MISERPGCSGRLAAACYACRSAWYLLTIIVGGYAVKNKLMVGLWRYILKFPPSLWEKQIYNEVC